MFNENGDISHQLESSNLEFFSKFVGAKEYGAKGTLALDDFSAEIFSILDKMWEESPELTIKNIFQKGDCRGGAKEKRLFIVAMNWLIKNHIEWANLEHVPEYRYWKDLVTLVTINKNILHKVVDLFATQLQKDVKSLIIGESVSLCAKWVPTEGCAEDKLFPEFLKSLRKRMRLTSRELRTNYLTPLRAHLKIVETSMCENKWEEIDYSKVPSVAMQRYRKTFEKRDSDRFSEWIGALSKGEAKVNVSQLFPHDVVKPYLIGRSGVDELIEAQFNALVEETRKLGTFKRSLVISDTSGSMAGTPMDVSISLGILISRCLDEPFKNFMINFSEHPKFTQLSGNSLYSDVKTLKTMDWGGNTNLDAVFDMLLEKAIECKVPADEMPTRLYILTDMQFDAVDSVYFTEETEESEKIYEIYESKDTQCSYPGIWMDENSTPREPQTPREPKGALSRTKQKFSVHGYTPPEIVCWNLRGNIESFAMSDKESGVCMISGFSPSVMKCIMRGNIPNPYTVMTQALLCERYERLNFPGKKVSNSEDICGND